MKILVDRRESPIIVRNLKELGFDVDKKQLEVGDYVISDIVIERKTTKDFVNSITDGRLFKQIKEMCNFKNQVLILEGKEFETNMSLNAIRGAISSLVVKFKIPIIWTESEHETAKYLYAIANQLTKVKNPFCPKKKKTNSLKETQEQIISSVPSVGITLARNLLNEFKTVENIFTASEEKLTKVKKLGKKKAKIIRRVLESKY